MTQRLVPAENTSNGSRGNRNRCRAALRGILSQGFCGILLNRFSVRLYNLTYENSPMKIKAFLARFHQQPTFDFEWKLKVAGGRIVKVPVTQDDPGSWEFAVSYGLREPGVRALEEILGDYYGSAGLYIDIGAHRGARSLYPLSIGARVVLFEPNVNFRYFTESLFDLNGFTGYTILNMCLSDRVGESTFYLSPGTYMSSLDRWMAEREGPVVEMAVEVGTLDEYFATNVSADDPKVIKIDVEGNEYPVLKGGRKTIARHSPTIVIEILPGQPKAKDIFEFLDGQDYSCFRVVETGYLRLENVSNYTEMKNSREFNYLFVKDANLMSVVADAASGG